jgi:hypothetical protein
MARRIGFPHLSAYRFFHLQRLCGVGEIRNNTKHPTKEVAVGELPATISRWALARGSSGTLNNPALELLEIRACRVSADDVKACQADMPSREILLTDGGER